MPCRWARGGPSEGRHSSYRRYATQHPTPNAQSPNGDKPTCLVEDWRTGRRGKADAPRKRARRARGNRPAGPLGGPVALLSLNRTKGVREMGVTV